jgi:hypothetical protein
LSLKPVATVSSGVASKPAATIFSSLTSKLVAMVSPGLTSKPVVGFLIEPQNQGGGGFFGFGHQNLQLWFGDLNLKIITMVSWFGLQNQAGFGLSVAPQNRRRDVIAGHASRSTDLLRVESNLARVSQSCLKTGGAVTTGGACGIITEVASGAS